MVKITERLVRKKAEHNESVIGTLEELSLHQEDVERIEYLQNWCKDLSILYLQSNLISKIENLHKLKRLQYLNLAINNIERIENLEGCESLEKLDLTLNFVGDLESVGSLHKNERLKHLYLTGNPCVDFAGYREYVVAKLPQLETLDSTEISRSERIKALQTLDRTEPLVRNAQEKYKLWREEQRKRLSECPHESMDDEEFWRSSSEHAPETRFEMATRSRRNRKREEETEPKRKMVKLFARDGRPLNVNQAKVEFKFDDSDPAQYVLDLAMYKYLDTSLVDVDLQPIVVRVTVKDKVFQFVLPEEIYVDRSTARRSQATGHLVMTMPKVNYRQPLEIKKDSVVKPKGKDVTRNAYLEIDKKSLLHERDASKIAHHDIVPPLEYI